MSKSCKCTLNEDRDTADHLKNNKEKGTTVRTHHSRRCHPDNDDICFVNCGNSFRVGVFFYKRSA